MEPLPTSLARVSLLLTQMFQLYKEREEILRALIEVAKFTSLLKDSRSSEILNERSSKLGVNTHQR
jgi:hypothetical protein